jgi:Domain of unknown function (DUF1848)
MKEPTRIVISASRRTDIPAFYMPWFMERIEAGFFETINPFNQQKSTLPASPDTVHSIVLWSKNFGPFIRGGYADILKQKGFNLFFNFTVNSEDTLLEPQVPPLSERLQQLAELCRWNDPRAVAWRFDPICFYKTDQGPTRNNLSDFELIAEKAAQGGITRCITSFMDDYAKIRKRTAGMPGFAFVDPPLPEKTQLLTDLKQRLDPHSISLYTCCEKTVLDRLPQKSGIRASACIPNELLMEIFGGKLSLKRDTGQRTKKGCGCAVSRDIGSYALHPCYHNCLFCYANPKPE